MKDRDCIEALNGKEIKVRNMFREGSSFEEIGGYLDLFPRAVTLHVIPYLQGIGTITAEDVRLRNTAILNKSKVTSLDPDVIYASIMDKELFALDFHYFQITMHAMSEYYRLTVPAIIAVKDKYFKDNGNVRTNIMVLEVAFENPTRELYLELFPKGIRTDVEVKGLSELLSEVLTAKECRFFVDYYSHGRDVAVVGKMHHLKPDTVKSRVDKLLEKLRPKAGQYLFDNDTVLRKKQLDHPDADKPIEEFFNGRVFHSFFSVGVRKLSDVRSAKQIADVKGIGPKKFADVLTKLAELEYPIDAEAQVLIDKDFDKQFVAFLNELKQLRYAGITDKSQLRIKVLEALDNNIR